MRNLSLSLAALALAMVACTEPAAPATASDALSPGHVSTLQEIDTLTPYFARNTLVGTTTDGKPCGMWVEARYGTVDGTAGATFEIFVSIDEENLINGAPLPLDARDTGAGFDLDSFGGSVTHSFAPTASTFDVEVSQEQASEGRRRLSHVRGQKDGDGLAFVEIWETLGSGPTTYRRCEKLVKP